MSFKLSKIFISFLMFIISLTTIKSKLTDKSKFRLAISIIGDWKEVEGYKNLINLKTSERFEVDICWNSCKKEIAMINLEGIDEESDVFILNKFPKSWGKMQDKNKLLESSSSQTENIEEKNENIFEEKVEDVKGKNKMMETERENELIIEIQVSGIWNGEKFGIDVSSYPYHFVSPFPAHS